MSDHSSALRLLFLLALAASGTCSATVTSSFAGGTLTIGSDGGDAIVVTCPGGNVLINAGNPGSGVLACTQVVNVVVSGGPAANDINLQAAGLSALVGTVIDGGAGNDTIVGSNRVDNIDGGADIDTITAGPGNDFVLTGSGDDVTRWNPGDGSDAIDGQGGNDVLRFNGSNVGETVQIIRVGADARLTRTVAAISMDLVAIPRIEVALFGGIDRLDVGALNGTAVTDIRVDLAASGGGGDAAGDLVTLLGGPGDEVDTMGVGVVGGIVQATHGQVTVEIVNYEAASDALAFNSQAGDDVLQVESSLAGVWTVALDGGTGTDTAIVRGTPVADAITLSSIAPFASAAAGALVSGLAGIEALRVETLDGNDSVTGNNGLSLLYQLTIDGGAGSDILNGGDGADTIIGGADPDTIDGNRGNDVALMGDGDDVFVWDPGDGSDTIEGEAGNDTLRFNGANISENFSVSANGPRLRLTRDVAAIVMDNDSVETVQLNALGGADTVNLDALSQTDLLLLELQLAATGGGGDAQADSVIFNGSAGADAIGMQANAARVDVTQGSHTTRISTPEAAFDRLTVNGLGGDDVLTATAAALALIGVTFNGSTDSGAIEAGDALIVGGDSSAETYTAASAAGGFTLTRSIPAMIPLVADAVERLQIDFGAGADTFNTRLLPVTRQVLDGGAPGVVPGDFLNVSGFSGDVSVSPITLPGLRRIDHVGFEQTTTPLFIEANLNGRQQIPPNPSTAIGSGTIGLNGARDAINVAISYTGLAGTSTAVRLHAPAPRGIAAPSIRDLPVSGANAGTFSVGPFPVTATDVAQLRAGQWYVSVSSSSSPNGEIRGQFDGILFEDGFE